VAFSLSKTIKY